MFDADPTHTAPDCSCGKGKMRLLRAGQFASNPGRYYFKCPEGVRHYKNFIWCDEFNLSKESSSSSSVLWQHMSTPTVESTYKYSQPPHVPTSANNRVRNRIRSDSNQRLTEPSDLGYTDEGSYKISLVDFSSVQVSWQTLMLIVFLAFVLIMLGVVVGMHLSCA